MRPGGGSREKFAGSDLQLLTPLRRRRRLISYMKPVLEVHASALHLRHNLYPQGLETASSVFATCPTDLHTVHTRRVRQQASGSRGFSVIQGGARESHEMGARASSLCRSALQESWCHKEDQSAGRSHPGGVAIDKTLHFFGLLFVSSLERLGHFRAESLSWSGPGKPVPSSSATLRTSIFKRAARLPAKTHEKSKPRRRHSPASQSRATSLATGCRFQD